MRTTGETMEASTAAEPKFGILPFILTSIYGTAGAIVLGVPVGFMTAVFLAKVAMLTEFFAPICLALGVFTRIAALSVIILMAVAMTKHVKNGYFSNWSGKKTGEGVEFHLLYAGSALALLLTGPGPWSVDAWCMDIVHVIFG